MPCEPALFDSEYYRNGTANLFIFLNAAAGWREVKVTDTRNKTEFAYCMRDLVDTHFPDVTLIRVVLDNLNTHIPASLYHTFEPAEARRGSAPLTPGARSCRAGRCFGETKLGASNTRLFLWKACKVG